MTDIESNDSSSHYPEEVVKALKEVGIYNIDAAKNYYVWQDEKGTVLSLVKNALSDYLRPPSDEGEEGYSRGGDYQDLETAQQIVNEPLVYIKSLCSWSTYTNSTGKELVSLGAISKQEASKIIDKALELTHHTRIELDNLIQLPKMADAAMELLKRIAEGSNHLVDQKQRKQLTPSQQDEVDKMMNLINPLSDESREN